MARPGYNEDNSLNVAPTGTPVGRPNPHTSTGFSVNDNAGTGTTTGRPNPHTDTGFSGGQTLAGGGNNPGYQDNFFPPNNQGNQPPPPPPNDEGGGGGETGLTGSGSSGGSGSGMGTLAGVDMANAFMGTNYGQKKGLNNLINSNTNSLGVTGNIYQDGFNYLDSKNTNTGVDESLLQPTFKPTIDLGNTAKDKVNDYIGIDAFGGEFGLNDQGYGFTSGSGNTQLGVNVGLDGKVTLGGSRAFAHGGPVGLMSLPHGYAAGGGVNPSDWRILQSILASGGNPEDYVNYADGGQVIPATSIDPTADDYFLKEFYKYMKRYLPGYDKEQDYYRQRKNRERMKREAPKEEEYPVYDPENPNHFMAPEDYKGYDPDSTPPSEKNPAYDPDNPNHFMVPEGMDPELFKPGTPTLEAAEGGEVKPFGGTRERVLDQVEAFDNAPVHMEEPNVNMYGKSVPLTIARKAQKYMEGLDPVKRQLVQEMLNMFQMKKQQEMTQEGRQEEMLENNFFGPNPSYKNSMNI